MTSTPTPPHTPAARPQRTRGSTSPPTRSAAETACSANPPPPSSPRGSRLLNLTPTPTPTPSFTARQRHSSPTTHPPLICSPTAPTRSPLLSASPLSSTPGRLGLQWLTLTPPCPDPGSSLFCCGVQPAAACLLSLYNRTLRPRAVRAKPPFVSCLRRASLPCRRDEGRPAPSQPARCPPWVASSQPRHKGFRPLFTWMPPL